MSDLVNADPNDVRKLARALQQFEQKVNDANKQAQRAIDQANWHDSQKDRFASRYKEFHKQTNNFVAGQVRDFVKSLNSLAADLERAKSRRF
jgi:uncharacterized protein YukE